MPVNRVEQVVEEVKSKNVNMDLGSKIYTEDVTIGFGTNINGPIIIKGDSPCSIGKYCAIGDGIRIITVNHDVSKANNQVLLQRRLGFCKIVDTKGPVIIGSNVWIGDNAIILSGVTVGDGAAIGAGSVVTNDIPPFGIAMGIPARTTRKRFDEKIIAQLLKLKWWDWTEDKMRQNKKFFETDLTVDPDLDLSSIIES